MARYVVKDGKIELYQDNKTTATNNSQSSKWYNNFFKKGDSNPLKAAFYTGGDVIGDLLTGALSPIEGVMDLGANVLATGANALGYKEQAQKLRNFADHNSFETMFKDEATETGSVLGDTSDKIVNLIGYTTGLMYGGKALSSATGVGNIGITGKSGKTLLGGSFSGGNIGVTIAGKTLNLPTLALVGGASSGLQEANSKENVNEAERWTKAISSSLIEGTTEGLFGLLGVGGSDFSENIAKKVASKFSSRAGKMLAQIGVASAGESTEEFLSYVGNYLVNNHLVDKLGEADFRSKFDWGELGEQMALAFVSSALTQGGGSIVNTNNAIKSAEQQLGRKLTNQEKAQVTQSSIEGTLIEKIDKLKKQQEIQNLTAKIPTVNDIVTQEKNINEVKLPIVDNRNKNSIFRQNQILFAKNSNIDYNTLKSKKLDSIVMEKYASTKHNYTAVNDFDYYYRILNRDYGDYEIINAIKIDGNEEYIKSLVNEEELYANQYRKSTSTYIVEDGIRSTRNDLDNVDFEGEESTTDFINRISEEYGIKINNARIDNGQGNGISKELDKSSFSLTKKQTLEQRLFGDELLDAQDLINELKSVGAKVDDNGYVTVYHQTTPENANKIRNTGKMISNEQDVFFSTSKEASQSDGRGPTKLEFKIPAEMLLLDDIFSDNADVKIPLKGQKVLDISNYLVNNQDNSINMPPVDNNINTLKVLNPLEISKLNPQDANTTPILPTIKVSSGKGKSKFANNIENKVNMLSEESKNIILSDNDVKYYKEVTNKESLEKAFKRLNDGGQSEVMRWLNNENGYDDVDIAEGWILLKQYQDSIATETDLIGKDQLNRSMVQVAKNMRKMATKGGQIVQAFNILNRLTPEGMVYYAQSELSEAFEVMSKNKTKEWIDNNRDKFELAPEETQFILNTMQEVQQMEDGYDKRVKLAEIQKLMTDKLPPIKGAGIKAWMRISMLLNPKTQVRNVMGNAIIAPVNYFSDLFASVVDAEIAKKTNIRTTGATNLKNYTKGFKTGLYQSYNDFKKGINTRNIQGNRFELTDGKSFNDNTNIGKALNRVDSLLSFLLDAGDRGFYEASFTNSINNQMILNNTTEVTQEMIDIATQEALSRTWQDNNAYTNAVLSIRKILNRGQSYGIGDVLIPFAKTPANLTKAIWDYSPAGVLTTIKSGINLKRSLSNGQFTPQMQHEFVQKLGKATAGSILYILGYALAKAGIVSGESDDDKDTRDFIKNTLGVSSYSIKIGNKSFTYDWAQPISAPLSIMANIVNSKDNKDIALYEAVVSSLDSAGSILLEQSFVQSINDVLNNNDGVVSGLITEILELPARAIPTFSKQIADMIDGTQRQTFEYDQPIKSALNYAISKIPFASKTLSPSVDSMGREIQKYGGKNNIFNVFLNPANVNTENISESAKEIYNLYKETGETTIMPRVAPYYINKNGNKIVLDSKQRAEYQKISGKVIEQNIQNLIGDSNYNNLSNDEKVNVISNIVNFSYNVAQSQILGTPISDTYKKAYNYSLVGNVSDYYLYKSQKFESDYYENGNVVTNSKKMKIIKYINGLNLSIPEKAILIKMEYNNYNSYNNQIINYINKMEYSKFEKAFLLKSFGFDNYDKYLINQINSQNMSIEEKTKVLEYLGFTIRNGRVYS